jgi:hypothetical protein
MKAKTCEETVPYIVIITAFIFLELICPVEGHRHSTINMGKHQ